MKKNITYKIVLSSLFAALYVVITVFTLPFSFSGVQFRVAEVLNILPLFMPESIIGLTVGCFISNLFSSGNVLLDCTLGTFATFISSLLCYFIGKAIKKEPLRIILGILPPIIINAIVVPFTFLVVTDLKELYFINFLSVFLGQLGVLTILGIPLYYSIKSINNKYDIFK